MFIFLNLGNAEIFLTKTMSNDEWVRDPAFNEGNQNDSGDVFLNLDNNQNQQDIVRDIIGNFENEFHQGLNASRGGMRGDAIIARQKAEDLKTLQDAWIKEKMVPDILPYEEELIERVLERIRTQLEFIEMNSVELQTQEKDIKLMLVIVESELERVQFLIRSYVRLRLRKIDRYALYIQENGEERGKLNADEVTYMEGHLAMLYELFEEQFLRRLGGGNLGEDAAMVEMPPRDAHVFFTCTEAAHAHVEGEDNGENGQLALRPGEVYVMRYASIAEALSRGAAAVI